MAERPHPTIHLPGLPPVTVSDEKAEQAPYVICAPAEGPVFFSDDVLTTCSFCGCAIRHRPYMPKRPKKICPTCSLTLDKEAA